MANRSSEKEEDDARSQDEKRIRPRITAAMTAAAWETIARSAQDQAHSMEASEARLSSIEVRTEIEANSRKQEIADVRREVAAMIEEARRDSIANFEKSLQVERSARSALSHMVDELRRELSETRAESSRRITELEIKLYGPSRPEAFNPTNHPPPKHFYYHEAPAYSHHSQFVQNQQRAPPPHHMSTSPHHRLAPVYTAQQQQMSPYPAVGHHQQPLNGNYHSHNTNPSHLRSNTTSPSAQGMAPQAKEYVPQNQLPAAPAPAPAPIQEEDIEALTEGTPVAADTNGASIEKNMAEEEGLGQKKEARRKRQNKDTKETVAPVAGRYSEHDKEADHNDLHKLEIQILEIIDNSPNGMILSSSLPKMYQIRFRKQLEFRALGYDKMSTLLAQMPRIKFDGKSRATIMRKSTNRNGDCSNFLPENIENGHNRQPGLKKDDEYDDEDDEHETPSQSNEPSTDEVNSAKRDDDDDFEDTEDHDSTVDTATVEVSQAESKQRSKAEEMKSTASVNRKSGKDASVTKKSKTTGPSWSTVVTGDVRSKAAK